MDAHGRLLLMTVFVCLPGLLFGTRAKGQEPAKLQPQSEESRNDAKHKAIERARVVPLQMHFDLSQYIAMAVDKDEPSGVLNDSEIHPFVAPVAIDADWWIVLFVPEKSDAGPPVCVYLDKRLDVVRGYLIGPPPKQKPEGKPPQETQTPR